MSYRMVLTSLIASYIVIVIAFLVSLYFLRRRQVWGVLLGVVLFFLGSVPLLEEQYFNSSPYVFYFGIAAILICFGFLYELDDRNPRILFLFGIPVFLVAQLTFYYLPLIRALSIYLVIVAATVGSYDYSAIDVNARMRNTSRWLRSPLWPFSTVQSLVRVLSHGRPTRPRLATAYVTFQLLTLLAVPVTLTSSLNATDRLETIMIAVLGYLYLVRLGIARGKMTESLS